MAGYPMVEKIDEYPEYRRVTLTDRATFISLIVYNYRESFKSCRAFKLTTLEKIAKNATCLAFWGHSMISHLDSYIFGRLRRAALVPIDI